MAGFAVVAMVSRARELGFTSVVARCLATNASSARVLEKSGFAFVGNSHSPWRGGPMREIRDYAIVDLG